MDGKGRWVDNVFVERLWRSVKYEDVYLHAYRDGPEARERLTEYFAFYNRQRGSGYDLLIEFSTGANLRLFCDCFEDLSDGNNYSFHTPDRVFVVIAGGILARSASW
jgi:hypothetical protein